MSDTARIVTANDLADGRVVFLARSGGWSDQLGDAVLSQSDGDAERLLGIAKSTPNVVVEPYLVAVHVEADGRLRPAEMRERYRLDGPTVGVKRSDAEGVSASANARSRSRHVSI